MKGVIFNQLAEMVEQAHGIDAWEALLDATGSDGLYTAGASYPDEDLLALVAAASEATGTPVPDLVRAFGEFLFGHFVVGYPQFFPAGQTLKQFLLTVDGVIHGEVRKLYHEPNLPEFAYDDSAPDRLVMHYRSPRRLCLLAEGLITGAARHFGTALHIDHATCMHQGATACRLAIDMGAAAGGDSRAA